MTYSSTFAATSRVQYLGHGRACCWYLQYFGQAIPRRSNLFQENIPGSHHPIPFRASYTISRQAPIIVNMVQPMDNPDPPALELKPSSLRPNCPSADHIFKWKGVNVAPSSIINIRIIQQLVDIASRTSLHDTSSYSVGLIKFHIFCNIFSIPKADRLPASFEPLHSIALWAATDPSIITISDSSMPFAPVAVPTIKKYLSAIHAWHIAQGWPPPLSDDTLSCINWSL